MLNQLLCLVGVLNTSSKDIFYVNSFEISDFEDDAMAETADRFNIDCIIACNKTDCKKSKVLVYDPDEFLEVLKCKQND